MLIKAYKLRSWCPWQAPPLPKSMGSAPPQGRDHQPKAGCVCHSPLSPGPLLVPPLLPTPPCSPAFLLDADSPDWSPCLHAHLTQVQALCASCLSYLSRCPVVNAALTALSSEGAIHLFHKYSHAQLAIRKRNQRK